MRGVQITGPREVVIAIAYQLDDELEPILDVDGAVDLARSDIAAYWESLFDVKHLAFQQGIEPTWYRIKPLTRRQKRHLPSSADAAERAEWYVRCALQSIRNRPMLMPDGTEKDTPQPERKSRGGLGEVATEGWLDSCYFQDQDLIALMRMIQHISEASHPLSRASARASGDTTTAKTSKPESGE